MAEPIQQLVTLIQLGRRAREAASLEALGFVMVNETKQVLNYRQAVFWQAGHLQHVAAVSGLPQPNPSAPYTHWLGSLLRELCKLEQANSVQRLVNADVPNAGKDWADWLPAYGLWLPLKVNDADLLGGLLLASDTPWQDQDIAIAQELASSYSHALNQFIDKKQGINKAKQLFGRLKKRAWFWLLLLGILCIPVPQSVLAPAEVTPKDPFIVRAPQDGVVERLLIKPNQTVTVGTALFSLDQTALQTRHEIAQKTVNSAQESYRQLAQMAVTDNKSKLEMALQQGVVDEKQVELAYTADLLGRVQVAATQAGIAVFSDINDWQGKTVVTGERILTIAQPEKVEIAIHLPVGERFDAQIGTAVSLYPNANPLSAYEAHVTQIAYSAEPTRDGQVAYLIKAELNANQTLPRIGLSGTARLQGTRVPLIYYALRRPLTTVRQWLGV